MLRNKKAEIGETITWVVATVIILVVLTIFIFASSALAKWQLFSVSSGEVKVTYGANLETKTRLAFEKNLLNQDKINNWIKELHNEKVDDGVDLSYMGATE